MKYWIAVASAEHVRLGRETGFMQICHGKAAPLRRLQPGDGVIYYSPTETFRGKDKFQSFTAIGHVKQGQPYQHDMGGGFVPFRRDIDWLEAREMPIRPMLEHLEFASGNKNWGYLLRFGIFLISKADFDKIRAAMNSEN